MIGIDETRARSVRWTQQQDGAPSSATSVWRRSNPWITSIVDLDPTHTGGIIGLAPGRSGACVKDWIALQTGEFRAASPSGTDLATGTTAPPAIASSPPSAAAPSFVLGGPLNYTLAGVIHQWDRKGDRGLTDANTYCCVLRASPTTSRLMVMPGTDAVGAVRGGTLSPNGGDYQPLPANGGLNLVPQAWSPDGKHIAMEGWDPPKTPDRNLHIERHPRFPTGAGHGPARAPARRAIGLLARRHADRLLPLCWCGPRPADRGVAMGRET